MLLPIAGLSHGGVGGLVVELDTPGGLLETSQVMEKHPVTVQLRYLQTLSEIATENNSTVVFPLPLEWFTAFVNKGISPRK